MEKLNRAKTFVKEHAIDIVAGTAILGTCTAVTVLYKKFLDEDSDRRQELQEKRLYIADAALDRLLFDVPLIVTNQNPNQ